MTKFTFYVLDVLQFAAQRIFDNNNFIFQFVEEKSRKTFLFVFVGKKKQMRVEEFLLFSRILMSQHL